MHFKNWENLKNECLVCTKCSLCKERTQVVFGCGNPKSKILFVGEGPGQQEDLQGEPFVGRSGILLDKMLSQIGLDRKKNIYISNIVKCRPPKNRDPFPQEQDICINWLRHQFSFIKPKIVVSLGRIAGMKIIGPDLKITKDHGKFYEKKGIWFMATLHPAALLRDPRRMEGTKEDFKLLKEKINKICGDLN